jgi:DNA invertase Pin-like site-specific DNA recombinase
MRQDEQHDGSPPASLFRAAEYVRMSTEHQQYSTQNQADKIRDYAAQRGLEIVRTYADEGKSGLRIDGRASLQRLIHDVESGVADFQVILVYDISRWGRFQDADESAYYEYICRRAGIEVAYCAEQFENNGTPTSTIIKSVKRAMAGEYSRELSAKVLVAVEKGLVPLNTALDIVGAGDDDKALQAAMQDAYESGRLRGNRLKMARRLIERRRTLGASISRRAKRATVDVSSSSLVRVYEQEVERKKMILRKSDLTQKRLLFVISALRRLLVDENFINLLRAERLDVMPLYLAERVWPERSGR